jgi:hypothetical protein
MSGKSPDETINADDAADDLGVDQGANSSYSSKKKLWANRSVSEVDDLHFNNPNTPTGSTAALESSFLTRGNSDNPDDSLIPRSIEDYYASVEVSRDTCLILKAQLM